MGGKCSSVVLRLVVQYTPTDIISNLPNHVMTLLGCQSFRAGARIFVTVLIGNQFFCAYLLRFPGDDIYHMLP